MNHPNQEKSIRLAIESRLENVFLIGLAIKAFCSDAPFTEVEAYEIELAVVEAVNNAIKHAYESQPGHTVELNVTIQTDRISFEICDTGKKLKSIGYAELNFDPDDLETLPENGMGLYLIQKIMDEISYEMISDRNKLKMTKYFKKEKPHI